MNWDHPLNRHLVTGMSRSGKTSLAIHLAKNWDHYAPKHPERRKTRWIYAFDPDREFSRKCGWTVAINREEIIRLASQFRPVCFDPIPMFGEKTKAALEWFCAHVLRDSRKVNYTKLLIVDEIWKHTGKSLQPALQAIMHEGARQEIDSLIISQQLNKTNSDLRAQTSDLWAFRQVDANTVKWLKEDGFSPDAIRTLDHPGGFILRDFSGFRTGRTTKTGIPSFDASHQKGKADRPPRFA